MEKFAFILHPLSVADMEHLSPLMKYIPNSVIEAGLKMKHPFKVSHITGLKSPYAEAEGWFIGCPLTAKQMVELPEVCYGPHHSVRTGCSGAGGEDCRSGCLHLYRW